MAQPRLHEYATEAGALVAGGDGNDVHLAQRVMAMAVEVFGALGVQAVMIGIVVSVLPPPWTLVQWKPTMAPAVSVAMRKPAGSNQGSSIRRCRSAEVQPP